MTTIHRLESVNSDNSQGGVLITFDCGLVKSVAWRSHTHIDVKDFAKKCTEDLIDSLLKASGDDAANALQNTNWVSMCAGIAKHISDFNDQVVAGERRAVVERVDH